MKTGKRPMATMIKLAATAGTARSNPAADRRQAIRHSVSAIVAVADAHGETATMRVEDLSTHGCSLTGAAAWLRIGKILSIKLDDDSPVEAITRWVRGNSAGAEFFHPLGAENGSWRQLIEEQGF